MPDTQNLIAQAVIVDSTFASVPPPLPDALPPACANCGAALTGPFCSACGQHVADFHRSVWRFVSEFFDTVLCWDNKLLRTIELLVKYPGLLTHDFMIGRRVRYVHPLRLFLFTSAVCLALLQYSHDNLGRIETHATPGKSKGHVHVNFGFPPPATPAPNTAPSSPDLATAKDELAANSRNPDDALGNSIRAAVAAGKAAKSEASRTTDDDVGGPIDQMVKDRIAKAGGAERFTRKMTENFQSKLSWVALALLPVFALAMRGVYWRSDSYYFAHLIFSLHYHTFLLLFWTCYMGELAVVALLPLHGLWEGLARVCLLWPPVYLYLALRRMYEESRRRTVLKVIALGSMHLVAILIGIGAVGAMAFFSTTGD